MDEKLTAALARRLAAYSATAGVTLICAPRVGAQIVYTDPPDCDARNAGPCYLDFDQDGDAEIVLNTGWAQAIWAEAPLSDGPDAMYGAILESYRRHGARYFYIMSLPLGVAVGLTHPSMRRHIPVPFSTSVGDYGNEEGFFGVGFGRDGNEERVYFGWGRFERVYMPGSYGSKWHFILKDFAFEATPGGSIETGQTERLHLIAGEASPLVFPAEGGTFVYEATLTNASPDPATLDVWFGAPRGPEPLPPQRLGTVTLDPGDSLSQTFTVEIPATARPGLYAAAFYLGDFASQSFVSSQGFRLWKMAATATEPGADGASETHVLGGTYPNPSTGRAELTLAVARTQAVRLTVHDALGRAVATLHDGVLAAGPTHPFTFDGSSLPSGVYAVRVVGEDFADVRTLTLLR